MSDIKYQVFISSTFRDLKEERKKVIEVILMADCIPSGMESFVATDEGQMEVIKKVIDLCDYYIVIIGRMYGSVNDTAGISYTELEYNYAREKEIPILVFAIDESSDGRSEEPDPVKRGKLIEFRTRAMKGVMASVWSDVNELAINVLGSLSKAKTTHPRRGWQRATTFNEVDLRRSIMELTEVNIALKNKVDQLSVDDSVDDNLAFDNVDVSLHYSEFYSMDFMIKEFKSTLETVFKWIALCMMDSFVNEGELASYIMAKINNQTTLELEDKDELKIIMMQLKALKLISSEWHNGQQVTLWKLTQKGSLKLNELVLTKKSD